LSDRDADVTAGSEVLDSEGNPRPTRGDQSPNEDDCLETRDFDWLTVRSQGRRVNEVDRRGKGKRVILAGSP